MFNTLGLSVSINKLKKIVFPLFNTNQLLIAPWEDSRDSSSPIAGHPACYDKPLCYSATDRSASANAGVNWAWEGRWRDWGERVGDWRVWPVGFWKDEVGSAALREKLNLGWAWTLRKVAMGEWLDVCLRKIARWIVFRIRRGRNSVLYVCFCEGALGDSVFRHGCFVFFF